AAAHRRRSASSVERPEIPRRSARRSAADRIAEGYGRAIPALLARDDCAGDPLGETCAHRRAWQQPPRARAVPGRPGRADDRRAKYSARHSAGVRAERRSRADPPLLSRRSGGGGGSGRARGRAGGAKDLSGDPAARLKPSRYEQKAFAVRRRGLRGAKKRPLRYEEKAGARERSRPSRVPNSYFLIPNFAVLYSTGSAVSSAAMRSDRRKRRSLAVTSKVRRGCTTRAGAATFVSAAVCERLTKPTTASSVTFI